MTSRCARQVSQLVVTLLVIVAVLAGCNLRPNKKDGRKSAGSNNLIDPAVTFDRQGDGLSGRLQFKTTKDASCELSYYAKQPNVQPSKESPKVVACSSAEKVRTKFDEVVTDLRTDSLYVITIRAWASGNSKNQSEYLLVDEAKATATQTGDLNFGANDKLAQLWVARFDLPLKIAEAHRTSLATPLAVAAIKDNLRRKLGCQTGVPDKMKFFREADANIGIKNLATRDFAAATATPHPAYPGRMQLSYASLNDGLDQMAMIFTHENRDYSMAVRPITRLLNMEMSSTETLAFGEPQLAEAVSPLKIDSEKPLKLSWTASGTLLDLSYVTFQIGRPENDRAVYCVFDAAKLTGTVDASFLKNIEDGKQVVLAELVSNQIWLKYGWLITTYDWRSGRIEK